MKRMKRNAVAVMVVAAATAWVASTGMSYAVTISSNVALFQPVTVASGDWDLITAPASVMTDDVNGTRMLTTSDESGLWIDLGQDYSIEKVYVGQKTNKAVAGAKLRAYAADQTTEVGTAFTIPSGSNYLYTMADWAGVRWIKIADEGAKPTKMTDSLRELRAFAQVETYADFIPGVTATATSTYPSAPDLAPVSLCNNAGMTDQRGPVGDPTAKSIPSGPFWHTEIDVLTATVTFDLGASYNLDEMRIWNLNQLNHAERCVKHATIMYSTDGTNYVELVDTNGAEDGNYTIPQIAVENAQNDYSLAIDLTGITASYVSITALDAHGSGDFLDPANCVGLSEVRFYGEAVPSEVPGDTDNDGDVDVDDAQALAGNWGRTEADGGPSIGDFNNDRAVNAADASILAANWTGSSQESAAVPEPVAATLLLSLFAVAAVARPRRRTR